MSDTYIQGMTDEQSLAVMSERRLVIVRAGAGTGKTRVMISRAARLCASGRRVLMTTFTRAAREEMQERMSKMMAKGCGVGIMTLGSLAWRLSGKPELLSESERRSMMLGIIPRQAVDVDHEFDAHMKGESTAAEKLIERVSDVLKIIDRLHANGIYGDTINDDDRAEINNPEICRILEDWDALCSNRQVYDATTIFRKATDAIGNASEDLRQWDDILVDEAQDLSYVQYEMIRSLCGRDGRCFMVGDPDQSIYAFRSAIPGFMSTDYIIALRGPHDREDISLTRNYRCTKPVLDAAVNCVNSLFRQDRKVLISDRPGKRPRILRKPGEAKEGKLIADRIGELIASGVNPGEIAVIARAHYALNETITHLAHNRIPYIQVGRSFMSRPEVVLITSMFRLLSNANDFSAAKELLGFLYPGKKDMDAVVQIHPEMSAFAAMCEAGGRGAKAREMTARLKSLAALYGDGASAIHILESFIRDADLHERMKKNKEAGSISHSLSDLRRMAENSVSVQNMNEGLQERMIVSDGGKTEDGHVFVGTIFASKGLEFEHVFIPGMFNGCFPSKKSMSGMGDGNIDFRYNLHHFGSIDEEKRLLYVAMTRARQELTMTYPDHTGRGKMARKVTPSTLLLSTGIMMP